MTRRRCRQLLSTECDARSLLFTIVVLCIDDAKVEQEASQLLFEVKKFLFYSRLFRSLHINYSL